MNAATIDEVETDVVEIEAKLDKGAYATPTSVADPESHPNQEGLGRDESPVHGDRLSLLLAAGLGMWEQLLCGRSLGVSGLGLGQRKERATGCGAGTERGPGGPTPSSQTSLPAPGRPKCENPEQQPGAGLCSAEPWVPTAERSPPWELCPPVRLASCGGECRHQWPPYSLHSACPQLVKLCSGMVEAGKAYVGTSRLFVSGVRELSQQCQGDTVISECLQRFGDSLQEVVNYHMVSLPCPASWPPAGPAQPGTELHRLSGRPRFCSSSLGDVRKFKETKKQFDKVREDLELSLVRNAQAPRHRPHEVEEATGALTLTRKCFRHLALDYVLQINVLQAKKKFEILDSVSAWGLPMSMGCRVGLERMLSFMHAQSSFFQQGHSLLHQLDPYMKKLAAELDQLVIDSAVEKREMERKHAAIQQRVRPHSQLSALWMPARPFRPHPKPGHTLPTLSSQPVSHLPCPYLL
ncbi:hypothetical protein P7K49_015112 [Saguinus oedipus]|uniref:Arf-GAP with coiled-coil, ANK repeat and PH domain-containing protein n=1 Tax=Saguinus oedipus TaxID=9490 RepID=A0ABQ9V8B2_SAGOE|nr:hypothetical protein P7K49_015112 [Saguinus oedipus]